MTADSTPYWGPMFPDWASAPIVTPGVQAYLRLEDPVLVGPAFQLVTLRARVVGVAGNDIEIKFRDDGMAETGFVEENTTTRRIELRFMGGVTTAADMFSQINTNSTLIEAIGPFNPADIFENGDDETIYFSPLTDGWIPLNHGAPGVSSLCRFMGPLFPDGPDADPPAVDPTSPPSAATFVLALENGVKLTLSWATDVFKAYAGAESRASLLDDPRQSYAGRALLLGDAVRQVRAQLSRYAALGRPFLLGLPYEETTLTADAAGFMYPVDDTSVLDWAVVGQRVIVVAPNGDGFDSTIQAVDPAVLFLDTGPGVVGVEGARIMPAMPVLFDPQQGFRRKRTSAGADYWEISGRASLYGFPSSAVPGELQLGTVATSGAFDDAFLRARTAGAQSVEVSLQADSLSGVTLDESFDPTDGSGELIIHVEDNATTMAELADALNSSSQLVYLFGDWTDADVIATGDDEFSSQSLIDGADAEPGQMGLGATVTTLGGRPLWDRGIVNTDTIGDSMQSMTETVDLGGIPFQVGCADEPDWGRQVSVADDERGEWQWLKAFLTAVRGRWKSWWLPTGRADLESVADATATTLTIDSDVGDYDLWASRGYAALRVEQDAGIAYVTITSMVDNLDGTLTLTVAGDALAAAPATLISWCELCRFASDDFEVLFGADGFSMAAQARVIRNVVDA